MLPQKNPGPAPLSASAMADAEAIVKQVGIPPQPKVVMDIYKECKTKVPSFQKIAGLIAQDPSLSARVIKIVNSPFYGRTSKISSINQAVTMLGLQNFLKVVLTASLREVMAGGSSSKKYDGLWKHSLYVARIAEFVATWMGTRISADHAYMAGLFHDCAIPVLIKKFKVDHIYFEREKAPPPTVADVNDWIVQLEEREFKTNHSIIGGIMARAWGMAPEIGDVIRDHHVRSLDNLSNRNHDSFWFILRVSDYLSEYFAWKNGGCNLEIDFFQDHSHGLANIGFTKEMLQEVGVDMGSLLDFIEDMFDILDLSLDE